MSRISILDDMGIVNKSKNISLNQEELKTSRGFISGRSGLQFKRIDKNLITISLAVGTYSKTIRLAFKASVQANAIIVPFMVVNVDGAEINSAIGRVQTANATAMTGKWLAEDSSLFADEENQAWDSILIITANNPCSLTIKAGTIGTDTGDLEVSVI